MLESALAALSGCSGGDDPPPITAQATADSSTATWNSATTIDVLANDSVSRGDKRLAAVARQPANGTATVADGRISYRPRDGFFGSNTLRYTMDTPFSSTEFSADTDPVTLQQVQIRTDLGAYRVRRLAGGLVSVSQALTLTDLDGSQAGRVQTISTLSEPGGAHRLADDAPGSSWVVLRYRDVGPAS